MLSDVRLRAAMDTPVGIVAAQVADQVMPVARARRSKSTADLVGTIYRGRPIIALRFCSVICVKAADEATICARSPGVLRQPPGA